MNYGQYFSKIQSDFDIWIEIWCQDPKSTKCEFRSAVFRRSVIHRGKGDRQFSIYEVRSVVELQGEKSSKAWIYSWFGKKNAKISNMVKSPYINGLYRVHIEESPISQNPQCPTDKIWKLEWKWIYNPNLDMKSVTR